MTRLCLDTSAYSHFRRGDTRVIDLVDRAERIGMPCVVLGELRAGFTQGSRREAKEDGRSKMTAHDATLARQSLTRA